MTYDLAAHQRERIRTLERDNAGLRTIQGRLERLMALLLRVAAGDDCDPLVLLTVLEHLDSAPHVHPAVREAREVIQLEQALRDARAAA
jgi:hypothetical protein